MTEITNEFVDDLIYCDDDWTQFIMINSLSREELITVVATLLGMYHVKMDIVRILGGKK